MAYDAYPAPGNDTTFVAKIDLRNYQYRIVVNSTGGVGLPAADVAIHGILQNKPNIGEHATVRVSGVSKVIAGAAIVQGAAITTMTSGFATTAANSTDYVLGFAETACNSGSTTSINVTQSGISIT